MNTGHLNPPTNPFSTKKWPHTVPFNKQKETEGSLASHRPGAPLRLRPEDSSWQPAGTDRQQPRQGAGRPQR